MENATASPDPDAASRRRSGRVVRAPEKFSPEPVQAAKRKRAAAGDDEEDEDIENEAPDDDEEMSDATDGEDRPARRSKSRAKPASRTKKPAIKKPKTNGVSLSHAANLPSRPKKTVALKNFAKPGDDDLYGTHAAWTPMPPVGPTANVAHQPTSLRRNTQRTKSPPHGSRNTKRMTRALSWNSSTSC